MKGKAYKMAVCCMMGTLVIGGSSLTAKAANLETEVPTAGIAVALNNYFAGSVNPEAEIVAFLNPTVTAANETAETTAATETTQQTTEPASIYDTIAISQVSDYVNVRSLPSTDSEIVGKIYNNCAATILSVEGEWYKIESGSVTGYIKSEYFITGDQAEALAVSVGHVIATVNTMTLNVRESQGTDCKILTQLPQGGEFTVIEQTDQWVKLAVDSDVEGWVSKEFVDIRVDFDTAISIQEEQDKLAKEAAAKKAAEEAAAKAAAAQAAATQAAQKAATAKQQAEEAQATTQSSVSDAVDTSSSAALREAVVAYALQFVGNPYVYGGNSLTEGTDCSGFTKLIYEHFGYSLNRISADQAYNGTEVSLDELLPGDLLLYKNGGSSIGHVALYIGNGQVVHASTSKTGIIVSNAFYRTPVAARRIIQ